MSKYIKKPVVIEAVRWNGDNWKDVWNFLNNSRGDMHKYSYNVNQTIDIHTLEGVMIASLGDWIIRGVQGELYPCKPDIFSATYELADSHIETEAEKQAREWQKGLHHEGYDHAEKIVAALLAERAP